jgi:hypothetical protein
VKKGEGDRVGLMSWLRRRFWPASSLAGVPSGKDRLDYSIPIRADRTLDELVDTILEGREIDVALDELCFVLSVEFGLSLDYAALAWDRVEEGIERARAGDSAQCPDRDTDPVGWISFQRAMTIRPLHLIDQASAKVAALEVYFRDDHFEGTISLDATPPQLRELFEQFEEVVENQVFSLLDDIEEKIAAIPLRAVFENGAEADVVDLQVFPSTKAVSFKTRQPTTVR